MGVSGYAVSVFALNNFRGGFDGYGLGERGERRVRVGLSEGKGKYRHRRESSGQRGGEST